jgi:hypothetical protein
MAYDSMNTWLRLMDRKSLIILLTLTAFRPDGRIRPFLTSKLTQHLPIAHSIHIS